MTTQQHLISETTLVNMLMSHKGAEFVSVLTSTEPKLLKKHRETKVPCPFRNVRRVATRHGMLGASYQNAVNNRRESEGHPEAGEFVAEQLWNGHGEHVDGSRCLVRHKDSGKIYMVFYPRTDIQGTVQVMADMWMADGREVSAHALRGFLPPVREGSNRQETDKPVAWRVIAVENIDQLKMGGVTYVVAR